MTTRRATCCCGQLHLTIEGEPSRISMCHCLECQRRTGAVISNQARFRREQITINGKETTWMRTAESEPSRISMCHCLECQRRTGAVISNQARFRREQITINGKETTWMRTAESE